MEISETRKMESTDQCEPPCFVHKLFGINILEQVISYYFGK